LLLSLSVFRVWGALGFCVSFSGLKRGLGWMRVCFFLCFFLGFGVDEGFLLFIFSSSFSFMVWCGLGFCSSLDFIFLILNLKEQQL
jgi:hypothetical protein